MTQREKLMRATMMAQAIKSVARRLEFDARNYDCSFPLVHARDFLAHARDLNNIADEFLKLK